MGDRVEGAEILADALQSPNETGSRCRVLIAEDEPSIARMISRMVSSDCEATWAPDGRKALDLFQSQDFDVLISDIAMPDMDGITLLDSVRQLSEDIPVILMTGKPTVESAIEAVHLHAFRYLPKPFGAEELRTAVREATMHARMARLRKEAMEIAGKLDSEPEKRLRVEFERARKTLWYAYQPIVDRRSRPIGYEALLRWDEGEFTDPTALFTAATELGVAEEFARQIRTVAPRPFETRTDAILFMNLDPNQIGEPYMVDRHDALAAMAERTVLEITEHISLKNVASAKAAIPKLKSIGYRLAVDDLGTGYSGLSSFAQIGPDFVKLDRALVHGVARRPDKQRLISGIAKLCHELDMQVIAEGIEKREDFETVVELGCDLFQGYLLGRPEPLQ